MTTAFTTRRTVSLAVLSLLAATMLGGCWPTEARVKVMLEAGVADIRTTGQQSQDRLGLVEGRLAELDKLTGKLEQIVADVDAINTRLAALDALADRIAAAEQSIKDQDAKISQLRQDADAAKTARAELVVAVSKAAKQAQVDEKFKNVDAAVATNDTKVRALEARDVKAGKDLTTLQKQAAVLAGDLKTLKDFAATLDSRMQDLSRETKTSTTTQNTKIAAISGGVSGMLTKDIELLQDRITALKAALKGIGGEAPSGTDGGEVLAP